MPISKPNSSSIANASSCPGKKAPSYDVVRAQAANILSNTGKAPTVRQLKAECGGSGSLATYSEYLKRWSAEALAGSGLLASLLAVKSQVEAHCKMVCMLVEQASAQARFVPYGEYGESDVEDDDDDVADDRGSDVMQTDLEDAVIYPNDAAEDDEWFEYRLDMIAEQSIARFCGDDDYEVDNSTSDVSHSERVDLGSAMPDRSATPPTEAHFNDSQNTPPYRADGGSQQAAHPLGATPPAQGEGGTISDGENGHA